MGLDKLLIAIIVFCSIYIQGMNIFHKHGKKNLHQYKGKLWDYLPEENMNAVSVLFTTGIDRILKSSEEFPSENVYSDHIC